MWPFRRDNAHELRSAQPYFLLRNGIGDAGGTLTGPVDCDVVVIGAGITGALVADALVETGRRVVVLDRLGLARGSTAATTALLQYEVDSDLAKLVPLIGATHAARAYRACAASFGMLERRFPELLALAGYERRDSLYLAANDEAVADLRVELAARTGLGLACSWLEAAEIRRRFGCRRPAAILSALGAQLDPVRFARAVLAGARRHGVRVFERVTVEAIEELGDGLAVRTQGGFPVRAAHVVVCAGYDSLKFAPPGLADLDNTFALVTEPLADPTRAARLPLIWENARPYFYMRGTDDGRLIAGGADVPFKSAEARELLLPRQIRRVVAAYEELFGHPLPPVAYTWAGSFARTPDGLPYIGPVPGGDPRLSFAMCFGGNGITYSAHAGEMIRAHVEGRAHDLDDVLGFARPGVARLSTTASAANG
jgi:glycine/D-amino acid oxidase-like deaminating enzyme